MIDGLSKKLDTSFENDVPTSIIRAVDKELKIVEEKSEEYKNKRLVLDDRDILRTEMIELIYALQAVRRSLEAEMMKPPSPRASDVEAYASLCSQIKESIRDLKNINLDAANLELNQRRLDTSFQIRTGNITQNIQNNNTFNLSSNELDNLISKSISNAKNNNQLDAIEVDFEVDSQIK